MRIAQRLERLEDHLAPQIARERTEGLIAQMQRLEAEFGQGAPEIEAFLHGLSDAEVIASLILSDERLSASEVDAAFREWPNARAMIEATPAHRRRDWQDVMDDPSFREAALKEG